MGDFLIEATPVRTIRGYELYERIGAGGFGEVYRAYQPAVGRQVAIKAILPQYASHPEFISRFETEAQLIAHLEHPHIVPLYDYWHEPDGAAYLVMRWLRGGSLRQALVDGPWPLEKIGRLLGQIAAALALAHERGVVHRDLKPDNILLDEGGNAYLSDFGIAKELSRETAATKAGAMVGSPDYIAPEQIRGQAITPQTDIYSLGLVLFELLTGHHPFPETTSAEMLVMHLQEPLPLLADLRPDLSPLLDEMVQQATAKEASRRFADVQALLEAFRQVVVEDGLAVSISPPPKDFFFDEALSNPYKGLQYFEEADADSFFGREALTARLVERLSQHNFLAVVGASGSGKSSLVRAGLIPALKREGTWLAKVMIPTAHPLEAMASVLTQDTGSSRETTSLANDMAGDANTLRIFSRGLLASSQAERLLLVVDQFEELFTASQGEGERRSFVDNLMTAAGDDPAGPIAVVLTLRADFYQHCAQYETLRRALADRQEYIGPMTADELRRAIEEPARRQSLHFEEGLVDLLLDDVGDEPGALPLLSHALLETWQRRRGQTLTLAGYSASGRVQGAIAKTAESVYQALPRTRQAIARGIFLRLTELGEGTQDTRRQADLAEILPAGDGRKEAEGVIQVLTSTRLITAGEETAQVAHEALIREWPRLRGWLDEDREGLRLHRGLTQAAAEWDAHDRDPSFLYRGQRLAAFDEEQGAGITLSALETGFLAASRAERDARQQAEQERQRQEQELLAEQRAAGRLRRLAVALAVFIVIAIVAAVIALNNATEADRQREIAEENERQAVEQAEAAATAQAAARTAEEEANAAEVAALLDAERAQFAEEAAAAAQDETARQGRIVLAQSLTALGPTLIQNNNDTELAILLALEAANINQKVGGEISWIVDLTLRQLLSAPFLNTTLAGAPSPVRAVAFAPDGLTLASATFGISSSSAGVRGVAGAIYIWDLANPGAEPSILGGHRSAITSIAFAPNGLVLATASGDRTVRLWNLDDPGASTAVLDAHTGWVNAVAFSPDGQLLASGGDDRVVRLWNPADLGDPPLVLEGHDSPVRSLAFSPDGNTLASGGADGVILLWDLAEPETAFAILEGHQGSIPSLAFSPDGRTLASGGEDGLVLLWDLAGLDASPINLSGSDLVWSVAFAPDGTALAAADADGAIRLWDLADTGREPAVLQGHQDAVYSVAFAPDSKTLASGSADREVRLWRLDAPEGRPIVLEKSPVGIISGRFTPDGDLLVTANEDGVISRWDTNDFQAPPTILELPEHELSLGNVDSVAIGPYGQRVSAAAGRLFLWNLDDLAEGPQILAVHPQGISSVAFDPTGETLAYSDLTVHLLDLADPTSPLETLGPENILESTTRVAFSHSGTTLAAIKLDRANSLGFVQLWDLEDPGTQPAILSLGDQPAVSEEFMNALAFSPDDQTLVTGGSDRTVRLWNLADLEAPPLIIEGQTEILWLAVSPTGDTLTAAGSDGAIRLWSMAVPTAQPVTLLGHEGPVRFLAFSPASPVFATGGDDGTIRLWPTLDGLREIGCRQVRRNLTQEEWALYLGEDEPYRETCP